ncbi:MAG: aminodeoxychorismate synthase component I [Proteobacteria bacterium]|nr:aminodeoxychorismate synthase component I [Pseudomonadota bacterium]
MDILNHMGTISGLHEEALYLDEPFIDFASRFAKEKDTVCLMSGGDLDCARYHILGVRPLLIFSGKGKTMELRTPFESCRIQADPFDTLSLIVGHFKNKDIVFPLPVSAGLFGYLAYDLKDDIEHLPRTSVDDLSLPSIYLTIPSILVVHDKQTQKTRLFILKLSGATEKDFDETRQYFKAMARKAAEKCGAFTGGKSFRSNFDQPSYMERIRKIRDYISAGDIYQVNMSQRFETAFQGSPFGLFTALYQKNPAPFFAFVNAGDHWIISTSPERFIKQQGDLVETRPIKGTRPRGKTRDEDLQLRQDLASSPKDDAELSMIVDLMRNDIGKVCQGGSVTVTEHKRVEAYANVYHLISIVEGRLDSGLDSVDLIRATFPGGSITGCPKVRSMEIIDELETHRRHIYTGSIGYIGFHDTMDLSIAIRTATIHNDRLVFSVGGAVVFDSDPEDEYHETLHKGKTLLDTLKGHAQDSAKESYVWVNGGLTKSEDSGIPLTDLGAQYGHGFFETLRVDKGAIHDLDKHIHRLEKAWSAFFPQPFPDLSWDMITGQVISACQLENQVAAVKIIVTRGSRDKAPWDNRIVVMARPYTHRLDMIKKPGIDLIAWDQTRQSFLADYKSLNYQYYYLAGKKVMDMGGDEALILNEDGSVSETNTANILFVRGTHVICPESPHVLKGIMEKKIIDLLGTWGYTPVSLKIFPSDIPDFDQVFLSNSLMGAVPVLSLDGNKLNDASALCQAINAQVLI